jgi:histidinol dehydrogenase
MNVSRTVEQIIAAVRRDGDKALCSMAARFDGIKLKPAQLRVTANELTEAIHRVSPAFLKAIKECAHQIKHFALEEKRRIPDSWTIKRGGARVGQLIRPVDRAGLYIPGGRYPYPSTVLMTAIPARAAGVKRIVMASPPKNLTPEVLTAASFAGVDEVYRVGGAGAIAALALGTKSVEKVDLIVGPGNQFVTEAKRQLYGTVGIDLLAGPSEVVIIADESVPAEYIEADLLAQAEHDPEAHSILLTTSSALISSVQTRLDPKIKSRVHFERVKSIAEAVDKANEVGPEHLELLFKGAEKMLARVRHAGAIFLGPASPAAMGDYVAGPSHVLPTNNAARFSSGLSVMTFLKRSSVIGFEGRSTELPQWQAALTMGATEGMVHHARSLRLRLQAKK